jgi:hypothetical protein
MKIREKYRQKKTSSIIYSSVAELEPEPEPLEPYHFDPRRTGTVSLL